MSAPASVLRRPGTMGWLIISPAQIELLAESPAVQRMLDLIDQSREVMVLEMAGGDIREDDFPIWMADLAGQPLRRIGAVPAETASIREAWLNAGVIFLQGGSQQAWREFVGVHLFQGYPDEILAEGSLLVAGGWSSGVLGTWMLEARGGDLTPGLGWLEGGLILPFESEPAAEAAVLELLEGSTPAYALGLPPGSTLAMGPAGEIEVWGAVPPSILLGRGWLASESDG
jgi:hypothetical protein